MLFLRAQLNRRYNFSNDMKKTLLLISTATLLLAACKSDPKTTAGNQSEPAAQPNASPTYLAGHWIDMDFCSRANQYGSVLATMTNSHVPYAYAITFDPNKPDSAICFNGMESWTVPVKYNVDTVEILNARPGQSVYLVYHSTGQKDMTMFDPTQGSVQMDQFVKSKANARDGYTAFLAALNHNLFSGAFVPLGKNVAKGKDIQFSPGGFILDWAPYDRYSVCTAGDCFVAANDIDVITLRRSKEANSEKFYGFKYNGQNDTLTFYNLVDTKPGEKGMYAPKGIAYQFLRKPADK